MMIQQGWKLKQGKAMSEEENIDEEDPKDKKYKVVISCHSNNAMIKFKKSDTKRSGEGDVKSIQYNSSMYTRRTLYG